MQRLSEQGLEFIKGWEKFRAKPYNDGTGTITVGYGHAMTKEEQDNIKQVTEEEALKLLAIDVEEAEEAVRELIEVDLSQNQFDSLVSFTFNVGGGALEGSTLRKLLNKGFYGTVADQMQRWVNADGKKLQGLVRRRRAEGVLFDTTDQVS